MKTYQTAEFFLFIFYIYNWLLTIRVYVLFALFFIYTYRLSQNMVQFDNRFIASYTCKLFVNFQNANSYGKKFRNQFCIEQFYS